MVCDIGSELGYERKNEKYTKEILLLLKCSEMFSVQVSSESNITHNSLEFLHCMNDYKGTVV